MNNESVSFSRITKKNNQKAFFQSVQRNQRVSRSSSENVDAL